MLLNGGYTMTREEMNERIIELLELLSIIPKASLPDKPEAAAPDDLKAH